MKRWLTFILGPLALSAFANAPGPQHLSPTAISSAAWQGITVSSAGSNVTGNVFLPKNPECFLYDADGNLTNDGWWTLTWDGENRLVSMVSNTNTLSGSRKALAFSYDWQGRRISKVVSNWTGSAWSPASSNKFLYDGWNLVAELNGTNGLVRSYEVFEVFNGD